jgi:hypothetical protein
VDYCARRRRGMHLHARRSRDLSDAPSAGVGRTMRYPGCAAE